LLPRTGSLKVPRLILNLTRRGFDPVRTDFLSDHHDRSNRSTSDLNESLPIHLNSFFPK
jgi:hypothetical protein